MYLGLCLIIVLVDVCMSVLDCSIQTDRRRIVTPDVECSCQDVNLDIFMWSDIVDLQQNQKTSLNKILLTKCSKLQLVLQPPHPSPLPQLMMKNMDEVVISLSKDMPHPNITITNVTHIQYRPMETEEENMQNMLLYAALAVGVVLVLVLSVFLIVLLWTRMDKQHSSDTKKVSRAQSWRYESSLYVNPTNRPEAGIINQPVYIPPPPPPDFIQSSSSSRPEAPNSTSSSPLLRPKFNSMREVDIVRSSLPTHQDRQRQNNYHGTPPAYRDPVDSIRFWDNSSMKSNPYVKPNEDLTLPRR